MQAVTDAAGVARFERVPSGAYQARAVLPGMPHISLRAGPAGRAPSNAEPRVAIELPVD